VPWGSRSLTVELRGGKMTSQRNTHNRDAKALLDYLILREVVSGEAPIIDDSDVKYYPLDAMDLVKAPCAGIVCYHKAIGEEVESG